MVGAPSSPYSEVGTGTPPGTPRDTEVQLAINDSKYGDAASAQQECQRLRRRVRELEAQLVRQDQVAVHTDRVRLVVDSEGALSSVTFSKCLERCSERTQLLFHKLLSVHVTRMWRRFRDIDTDNDGRIGDYDIREWLHRLDAPADSADTTQVLAALELTAEETVDTVRFENMVCLKNGVVSLRAQLGGLAADEVKAPPAAAANRLRRAVSEIKGVTTGDLVAEVLVEHMLQTSRHTSSSQGVHQLMLAIDPSWTSGLTVDFTQWGQLCSSLRSTAADSLSDALLAMWREEQQMVSLEFEELWRPNTKGLVDEKRILEMGGMLVGGLNDTNSREVLQLLQCDTQSSVDAHAYNKFVALLDYHPIRAACSGREENPEVPAAVREVEPLPDPETLSKSEVRQMFGLPECAANPLATTDDAETSILRNVVGVVRARHTTNWTLQKTKEGISLSVRNEVVGRKKDDRSAGVKIESIADLPAKLLYEVMVHPDLNATGSTASEYEVVCKLDPASMGAMRLAHSRVKIPLFADQDFALGEYLGYFHDSWVYSFGSVQDRRLPPSKGRCVRGIVQLGGWAFTPIGPSATKITFVSVVDPNRSVPKAMVSKGHKDTAKAMSTFIKNCHAHVKENNINLADYYE